MRRLFLPALMVCLLAPLAASSALAQSIRPQRTFFVQPRVGVVHYRGDNASFGDWEWEHGVPFGLGLEFGYQMTTRFSVSGAMLAGMYRNIVPRDDAGNVLVDQNTTERWTGNLFLKWTARAATARVAPFLQVGLHGTVGQTMPTADKFGNPNPDAGDDLLAIGPSAGLGLDIVLNNRMSFIAEVISNLAVPDEAADAEGQQVDERGRFDLLNFVGFGLKYSFKSAFTAVDVSDLDCPRDLMVNETGTFTASVSPGATAPVEYRWDFGDGTSATGLTATHSFDRAGTYRVNFTASNSGSTDSEACDVLVEPLPMGAEIISVSGAPMSFQVCEPVTVSFNANVRGDEPLTYRWEFGDGTTASGSTATHTYTSPGNYNVTLTLSNAEGSVSRSITIQALECEADICVDVTDLNSVYFGQNSSTLTEEGRAALRENIEILRECPDICVRIEGFAGPGERNPQQLSEDRARAVEQFYIDNGIAASRLMVVGRGRVGGTSKKEGAAQFRRVDSIPVPCVELGN